MFVQTVSSHSYQSDSASFANNFVALLVLVTSCDVTLWSLLGPKLRRILMIYIDNIEKIFRVTHVTDTMGVEFVTYQLKFMDYQWYGEWEVISVRMPNLLFRNIFFQPFLITSFLRS